MNLDDVNELFKIKDLKKLIDIYIPDGEKIYFENLNCSYRELCKTIKEYLHQGKGHEFIENIMEKLEIINKNHLLSLEDDINIFILGGVKESFKINLEWIVTKKFVHDRTLKYYNIICKSDRAGAEERWIEIYFPRNETFGLAKDQKKFEEINSDKSGYFGYDTLENAARYGQDKIVQKIMEMYGRELFDEYNNENSLMNTAAVNGHWNVVEYILSTNKNIKV